MFHGPPPGGGASRRCEDFRLCVTARPPFFLPVPPSDEYRVTLQRRPAPARNAHMCCGREPARFTCSISTSAVHDRAASIVCEIEQRCEPRRSARRRRFSQLDRRHGRRDDYLGTASHSAAGIAPCAAGRGVSCRCCAGKLSRFASWQRLRLVAAGVNHPMGRTCRPNV